MLNKEFLGVGWVGFNPKGNGNIFAVSGENIGQTIICILV